MSAPQSENRPDVPPELQSEGQMRSCCGESYPDGVTSVAGKMGVFDDYFPVNRLVQQFQCDNIMSLSIFVITCGVTAAFAPYWRPIFWDCFWIVCALILMLQGHIAARWKSSFGMIAYFCMLILLGALNLSHLLALRGEHVHQCKLSQRSFQHCETDPSLTQCLVNNSCTRAQIQATSCQAVGKEHCDEIDGMNIGFGINLLISFLTFSEPAWWALLLLIRLEGAHMALRPVDAIMYGDEPPPSDGETEPLLKK